MTATATATPAPGIATVTPEDRFLFDLQGFLILRGAIDRQLCADLLAAVRRLEAKDFNDAWREQYPADKRGLPTRDTGNTGQVRLNGLVRLDAIFGQLVAHPAILPYLREFQGDPQLVNTWSITKSRGSKPGSWHSGIPPVEYVVSHNDIRTPMLNVVFMLTDNTPGDGCLIVQPGSHKKNFTLPWDKYGNMGLGTPGSVEVTGQVGDVVLFSEALMHNGDAKNTDGLRTNLYFNHMHGQRTVAMYDPVNVRHYWMPPEVRAGLTPDGKHLTRWMEWVNPAMPGLM